MTAYGRPLLHIGRAVRQFLFCLAVVSFLSRALIPNGYMPVLTSESGNALAVTFCTMDGGTSTLLLELTNKPAQPASDHQFNEERCPFGIVTSQAAMPGQETLVLAGLAAQRPVLLPQRNQARPPLPALGPPLGSRAPPKNLG